MLEFLNDFSFFKFYLILINSACILVHFINIIKYLKDGEDIVCLFIPLFGLISGLICLSFFIQF